MFNLLLKKLIKNTAGRNESARLLIFNFHNIYKNDISLSGSAISYQEFKQQVKWINDHFKILPLTDGIDLCRSAKLYEPTACITLDDGYRSQFSLAKPFFDQLQISATFFISSGHINKLLWNDHIPLFFQHASNDTKHLLIKKLTDISESKLSLDLPEQELIKKIDLLMKYLPLHERIRLLSFMSEYIPKKSIEGVMLSEEEILEIANSNHTIGAHTSNHPILAIESNEVAAEEIKEDINRLEKIINKKIRIFAYPNGKPLKDYNDRDIQLLIENGIDYAVTTLPGYFSPGLDPLQIPRVNLSGDGDFKHYKNVFSTYRQLGQMVESRGYERTC